MVEGLMRLRPGALAGGRMRRVGELYGPEGRVDRVVAFGWREGASYTGEEMVEISCHGTPDIVDGVMAALLDAGARPAEPGEFTRRALLSGRMTALEVMELAALTGADAVSVRAPLREDVRGALAAAGRAAEELEAEIEFGEEHPGVGDGARSAVAELLELLERIRASMGAAEGAGRLMVMGPPNSGKSTFVNRLAGEEVALVRESPGTTRDGASVLVDIRGVPVRVWDSAGAGDGGIDAEAYRRAVESVDESTFVVWMETGPRPRAPRGVRDAAGGLLELSSRADLYRGGDRRLSVMTGEGWRETMEELAAWASESGMAGRIAAMAAGCGRALGLLEQGDYAPSAEELREVERDLAALMDGRGRTVGEAVERALERLCVGK
jgi:tRNA modification GTPase